MPESVFVRVCRASVASGWRIFIFGGDESHRHKRLEVNKLTPNKRKISKTVSQPQIDHIIIVELAQAGSFGAVEGHISGSDLPVVTDLVFCKDLTGRSLIAGKIHAPKACC